MTKEIIVTGKSVEDAIETACRENGLEKDDIRIEILERGKKSLFGLKVTPARVKITFESNEVEPAPVATQKKQNEVKKEDIKTGEIPAVYNTKAEVAKKYLEDILKAMGINDFSVNVEIEENAINLTLEGDELGFIIGRRGETLDAIQYLTGLVANKIDGEYVRISINSGSFREKREKTLEGLAAKLANTAIRTSKNITLEPMNPYERRIIHAAVSKIEGATSKSIGEEPNRRVVISSTNPRRRYNNNNNNNNRQGKPYYKKDRDNRGRNNNNRSNNEFRNNNNRPNNHKNYNEKAKPVVNESPKIDEMKAKQPLYSKIEIY